MPRPSFQILLPTATIWLLALLTAGCGATGRVCSLVPIPVSTAGHAQEEAVSRAASGIDSECHVLAASRMTRTMSGDLRVLDPDQVQSAARSLWAAEKLFYGESVEAGKAQLAQAWELYQHHPELLPVSPEERTNVYRALLVAVRAVAPDSSGNSSAAMLSWLARHMPDQEPTVRLLPPRMEATAALEVESAVKDVALLSAPLPDDCTAGSVLRVNGLAVGELPIAGLPISRGSHAVWFDCGQAGSWVRQLHFTGDQKLEAPDMALESGLRVARRLLSAPQMPTPELLSQIGPGLRTSLHAEGLVFVPVDGSSQDKQALLSTAYGNHSIAPGPAGRFQVPPSLLAAPFDWRRAGMWTAYAMSAALLGCGVGANLGHQSAMDDTNAGLSDRRQEADNWRTMSISCYATAGAAFILGATLNIFEVVEEPPR